MISELCPQAFIFLCFSLTQVTIDTIKGEYNKAFFKFWIMIIFTLMLNNLCVRGLGIVSWIIIFTPFMLMSLITTILLYVFGFNPSTGKLQYYTPNGEETLTVDTKGNLSDHDKESSYARPINLMKYQINNDNSETQEKHNTTHTEPKASNTLNSVVSDKSKNSSTKKEGHPVKYKTEDMQHAE